MALSVKFYDMNTSQVVKTFGKYGDKDGDQMQGIYAVAFAKTTPNVMGCTSCDHKVYLWNTQSGALLRTLEGHKDEVNGIDFHSKQQVCCTASDDCKCLIWDFEEGKVLRELEKHTKAVYGSTFLGDDNQYLVATCCFDQKARVWDIRDKQLVVQVHTHTDDVIGISYSSQQSLLATGSDDGLICLHDSKTWKKLSEINTRKMAPDNEVKRVAWSPCGTYLAAATSSKQVLVYKCDITEQGQPPLVAQLHGHDDCVFDVAWGTCASSNRKVLVSASHDKTSRIWTEVI